MHLFTCIVVTHLETLMKRNLKLDLLQWVFVIIQLKVFLHHHVPFDLKNCSENIDYTTNPGMKWFIPNSYHVQFININDR